MRAAAALLGVNRTTIRDWETGARGNRPAHLATVLATYARAAQGRDGEAFNGGKL